MLRKDLKPGTYFAYTHDKGRNTLKYWVPVDGRLCPPGFGLSEPDRRLLESEVYLVDPHTGKELVNPPTPEKPDAPHYASLTPEPIDVIDAWGLGFHLGNAIKYIARVGRKDGATAASDLRKAVTYIERHAASLEGRRAWK